MNFLTKEVPKSLRELFEMLRTTKIEIKKEHTALKVNKAVRCKKSGPKPGIECFYCKGDGHWKRNCPKYLADKKAGKIVEKDKGIYDIHVIDVYLTSARSKPWVFDTGSVALCNS